MVKVNPFDVNWNLSQQPLWDLNWCKWCVFILPGATLTKWSYIPLNFREKQEQPHFTFCWFGYINHQQEDSRSVCTDCFWILSFDCFITFLWMFHGVFSLTEQVCVVANWKLHFTLAFWLNNKLCIRCDREQVTRKKSKILVFHNSSDGGRRCAARSTHTKKHLHRNESWSFRIIVLANYNQDLLGAFFTTYKQLSFGVDPAWAIITDSRCCEKKQNIFTYFWCCSGP